MHRCPTVLAPPRLYRGLSTAGADLARRGTQQGTSSLIEGLVIDRTECLFSPQYGESTTGTINTWKIARSPAAGYCGERAPESDDTLNTQRTRRLQASARSPRCHPLSSSSCGPDHGPLHWAISVKPRSPPAHRRLPETHRHTKVPL